eukprot:6492747-Amphidinium_carterae.1
MCAAVRKVCGPQKWAKLGINLPPAVSVRDDPPTACMFVPPSLATHVFLHHFREIMLPAAPRVWAARSIGGGDVIPKNCIPDELIQTTLNSIVTFQAAANDQDVALLEAHGRQRMYPMWSLLNSLLMCTKLRRAGALREVLYMGLKACCHPLLAEKVFADAQQGCGSCPSEATISRHQLTLLSGFVLWKRIHQRRPHADPQTLRSDANFLLVDSSPQGLRCAQHCKQLCDDDESDDDPDNGLTIIDDHDDNHDDDDYDHDANDDVQLGDLWFQGQAWVPCCNDLLVLVSYVIIRHVQHISVTPDVSCATVKSEGVIGSSSRCQASRRNAWKERMPKQRIMCVRPGHLTTVATKSLFGAKFSNYIQLQLLILNGAMFLRLQHA